MGRSTSYIFMYGQTAIGKWYDTDCQKLLHEFKGTSTIAMMMA